MNKQDAEKIVQENCAEISVIAHLECSDPTEDGSVYVTATVQHGVMFCIDPRDPPGLLDMKLKDFCTEVKRKADL